MSRVMLLMAFLIAGTAIGSYAQKEKPKKEEKKEKKEKGEKKEKKEKKKE
jgi:hypothetical protein